MARKTSSSSSDMFDSGAFSTSSQPYRSTRSRKHRNGFFCFFCGIEGLISTMKPISLRGISRSSHSSAVLARSVDSCTVECDVEEVAPLVGEMRTNRHMPPGGLNPAMYHVVGSGQNVRMPESDGRDGRNESSEDEALKIA
eukprot:GFYU01020789.1.p2 GENE.GFYU01020789.1~~GFYU01020789.1.p2  ORF type:complete len:141 (-),score=0.28 GFYU01020789.1:162-584(-)